MSLPIHLPRRFRTTNFICLSALVVISFIFIFTLTIVSYNTYCHDASVKGVMAGLEKEYWKEGEIDFLPILMPVCDRPEYLKEVLSALAKNHDIDKTVLIVSQDGNNREIEALIKNITLPSRVIHLRHIRPFLSIPSYVHTNEYATAANVKFLLEFAFDYLKAPGAIVLESDLKPAADMFTYFTWAFKNILQNPEYNNVLNINSFNMDSRPDSDPYTLTPAEFTVWGWCTSADRWSLLKDNWTKFGNWDINVQENIRIPNHMVSMTPLLARVKNIGRVVSISDLFLYLIYGS
ncbi:hypothetical protein K7432_012862 [Basidiobolus ranarum]|uniref:alpha-1,3-mannosyl-glycoprotein 2-beta-N-acetylglucosaminyltransferase n=1 Tax=Basidiobolus ranarum TaxID=34480 RepID=A0ABR2WKA3_9FUNG